MNKINAISTGSTTPEPNLKTATPNPASATSEPTLKTKPPSGNRQISSTTSSEAENTVPSSEPVVVVRTAAKPVDVRRATKTEEIREQVIRYFIDPHLQVADIKSEVDRHYAYSLDDARANYENAKLKYTHAVGLQDANEAAGLGTSEAARQNILNLMGELEKSENDLQLKMAYTDAKNIVEHGLYTKRPDRDTAIFNKMLGATMRMHAAEAHIKEYSDPEKYNFHPAIIGIITLNANALMSKQLLTNDLNLSGIGHHSLNYAFDYMDDIKNTGFNITQRLENLADQADVLSEVTKIKNQIGTELLDRWKYLRGDQFIAKHFYPITLIGDLGLYTFEASVSAFAEGFALLNQSRSNRGVHGGSYQEPLVIYMHDLTHQSLILAKDNPESATLFKNLASAFHNSIKNAVWSDADKKSAFFAAHLLLHESDPKLIAADFLVKTNKNIKQIFDFMFSTYLNQAASDLKLKGFINESLDYKKKLYLAMGKLEIAVKYEKKKEELIFPENTAPDPFAYDAIEGLLSVSDEKTKKALEARILPGLEAKKAELKIAHNIGPDLKLQDFPKAYLNDLYIYKCNNYDPVEAFKSIREFLSAFKEKIYPGMSEEPLDVSGYKDFIQLGQGLSQPSPT